MTANAALKTLPITAWLAVTVAKCGNASASILTSSLDHSNSSAKLADASAMKRFWQILTLLLLALMVPASVCCWVPVSECEAYDCEGTSAPHDEAPALPGACPSDTIAHCQVPVPIAMPALPMLELADIIQTILRLNELAATTAAPVPLMSTAPPELRVKWVFVSRAALPARAPAGLA